MPTIRIYNGTPSTGGINNTASIKGATAIYMIAPDITDEYEIDFYLQLEIASNSNRLVKLNDNFVLDTVVIYPIPNEFQYITENIYGAFITSLNIVIEIWAIFPEVSLETLSDQIAELAPASEVDNILEGVLEELLPTLLPQIIAPLLGVPIPPLLPGVPIPPLLLPGVI